MIENDFDIPFVAELALREKQIQQNYRPIIAVHKWFARRPGTLFRALLLSEFGTGTLRDRFYQANEFKGLRIADPFMGGGTPLLEANRVGCDIIGFDINPMAYWIVRQEIEDLDLRAYRDATNKLTTWLSEKVGHFYTTTCGICGADADAKYFLWVKVQACEQCRHDIDLFSGYLLAEDRRHPKNVFICAYCGELNETENRKAPGLCGTCGKELSLAGPARQNRCKCNQCGRINKYPEPQNGPPRHRLFAIEYHCNRCRLRHKGRFFKKADESDLSRFADAEATFRSLDSSFIPDDEIPAGDETDRLHRWGYHQYREMFNSRQLLGLALSCKAISRLKDESLHNALATNLSDLLRYQNMLCRYDRMALKSLDIFSVHGFPVGLIQCESNILGLRNTAKVTAIGSGGWANIVDKYAKAKSYCKAPFEIRHKNGSKTQVPIRGETIGYDESSSGHARMVSLHCASSTSIELPANALDAVLTDPPYFSNVQYAELMDFCYVWLRRLVGANVDAFKLKSTRNANELTGNITMDRGLSHFTEGMSDVFSRMTTALKSGSPFVFTYHHNRIDAYYPIAVAMLDAGLTCTASLPCPAEMGGSIHISGTSSSVVDTIFVCRTTGSVRTHYLVDNAQAIAALVKSDLAALRESDYLPTRGDTRCVIFGHLIRLAVWKLRGSWDRAQSSEDKLRAIKKQVNSLGGAEAIEIELGTENMDERKRQRRVQFESTLNVSQFS